MSEPKATRSIIDTHRHIFGPKLKQKFVENIGFDDTKPLPQANAGEMFFYRESVDALQSKVAAIAEDARGTVNVSCILPGTVTGPGRLRAGLPPGTVLAHKTGSSGTHGGITAATNDIGLITLPDGRRLAVAVFVTDSRADEDTREAVIARIARVVYQEAIVTK